MTLSVTPHEEEKDDGATEENAAADEAVAENTAETAPEA